MNKKKHRASKGSQKSNAKNVLSNLVQFQASVLEGNCYEAHLFHLFFFNGLDKDRVSYREYI